jgi:glycosyltransferase involved in cell wall biosynthesis
LPDAVAGVSHFILNKHVVHGYFGKTTKAVIPNGLRSQRVPSPSPGRTLDKPLRIGFIGRLHPAKGVEVLLDALRRLPEGSYVAKLAGNGHRDYETQLRLAAQGLSAEFMGWVPRDQFYGQIDVLVVPSLYDEPQGMVLIEAANLGVPVIYSNRGGLGEMGAAFPGFRAFDPSQKEGLATLLISLLEEPANLAELQKPIGPIDTSFEIDEFTCRYRRLYEQVLTKPASARDAAKPIVLGHVIRFPKRNR